MSITIEKCIEGWTNSFRQLKVKADIVFLGDSLTYYGDFASVFPNKVVCNLGLRGDTLEGMKKRLEQIQIVNPDVVYLMAGINDVASCTLEEFHVRYETLICEIHRIIPESKMVLQSLLPVNHIEFEISCNNEQVFECNKQIKALASRYSLHYINLYSVYLKGGVLPKEMTMDGIHLKEDSYQKWYKLLNSNL